jgi:hypothetical protein
VRAKNVQYKEDSSMLLADIEEEISALTRFEKILLIEKISKMLLEEENPAKYFDKQGLWPGRRWQDVRGAEQAMREIESLQLDPLQIVACSHA